MNKKIIKILQKDFAILKTKFTLLDITNYFYSIAYFNNRLSLCTVDITDNQALKIIQDYNLKEIHTTENGVIYEIESTPFKIKDILIKEKRKQKGRLKQVRGKILIDQILEDEIE